MSRHNTTTKHTADPGNSWLCFIWLREVAWHFSKQPWSQWLQWSLFFRLSPAILLMCHYMQCHRLRHCQLITWKGLHFCTDALLLWSMEGHQSKCSKRWPLAMILRALLRSKKDFHTAWSAYADPGRSFHWWRQEKTGSGNTSLPETERLIFLSFEVLSTLPC